MATILSPAPRLTFPPRLAQYWPLLGLLLLATLAVAINPVGFVGAGGDDNQYLRAAECWIANNGPCVPSSHWWSRWPVVAPMVAGMGMFGETRLGVGLGALLYWAVCIGSITWIAARWFGRAAGYIAGAALTLTPIFTASALQPTADVTELALQLAALALGIAAFDRQSRGYAIAAGVVAGLALQARDTSFLFVGATIAAWFFLPRQRRRVLVWATAGFAGAMLAEVAVYALATGDPFWRYKLALHHATIPSGEWATPVDTSASPILNRRFISAWKREMGIYVAWPIDPWLNLFASPKVAHNFIASAVLFSAYRHLEPNQRQIIKVVAACAIGVALAMVYVLALDPKPRMFMLAVAASALITGALASAAWKRGERAYPLFVLGGCGVAALYVLSSYPASYMAEAKARTWIERYPDKIKIDEDGRNYLALLGEARRLPGADTVRPLLISRGNGTCDELLKEKAQHEEQLSVLDRGTGPDPHQPELCLLKIIREGE